MKGKHAKGFSLVFLLNRALVYVFVHSETLKRVHLGQDKGRSSCQEGGSKL